MVYTLQKNWYHERRNREIKGDYRDTAVNCVLDPSLGLGLEGQTHIKDILGVIREI